MSEPFSSQSLIFGVEGIDLKRSLDLIKPTRLARMTNVLRTEEGALVGRQGITPITTAPAGSTMHSIIRLNGQSIASVPTHHFVCLVDATIYWGTTAGIALVTAPIPTWTPSSLPAIMVPISFLDAPNFYETVWGVIPGPSGAIDANLKIREGDGVVETLGIFSPPFYAPVTNRAQTSLGTQNSTVIDNCDAAGWTNNAGTGGAPANANDAVIKKEGAASLLLTTAPGAAPGLYYNYWNKANAKNLNLVGAIAASDDDIIHLWIRTDRPDLITEFRVYFVVSTPFDLVTLPGTSATLNTDAYYKSFRPSDFTPIYEVTAATTSGAAAANATLTTLNQLPGSSTVNPDLALLAAQQDPSIRTSVQMGGGRGAWQEIGIIGYPLRRGEFGRIGTDATRTWANVTGLVLTAQINTNAAVQFWLDDIYLTGGVGPDTSPVGATQYDYRYTNICVETGEESNPSDIQNEGSPTTSLIDTLRRSVVVQSIGAYPFVDSGAILTFRQRFYRRGGTLGNNWYFIGTSSTNGGNFTDTNSDLALVAAPTLQIDNDVPIVMQSIWGPVSGILFGCRGNITASGFGGSGGTLFWSKVDKPGQWPASYTYEVCSISEELMAGFAHAGQSFVFSRENLYTAVPDLTNAAIMNVVPTQCKKGIIGRCAFVAYAGGVFFLAKDGVFFSPGPGGAEKNISDDFLEPIFRGEYKSEYQPIDWSHPESISMEIHESEVWLLFAGKGNVGSVSGIIGDAVGPAIGQPGGSFGHAVLCGFDGSGQFPATPIDADVNGNFSIPNVPAGSYSLVVWNSIDSAHRFVVGPFEVTESNDLDVASNTLNVLGAHPSCPLAGGGDPAEEPIVSEPQVWIFNTLYQFWRHHSYSTPPARFYSQPGEDLTENSIMLVGSDGPPAELGFIPSESPAGNDFFTPLSDCHIRTGALDQGIPRVSKLYGDAFIDVDVRSNTGVTITPYINSEEQALTATTLVPVLASGRERYYIPIDEILARNISLDISWTPEAGILTPPIIYQGGVSYTPQPDTSETRVTNWDTQGRLNDKWVKGVLFEVDTGGIAKSVDVLADGAVVQNISVLAAGRKVLQFSWPEFRGRILRLAPTDTVQWMIYDFRWIFDEEPLSLLRWESQEVDHGFHGQQVPIYAHISIRSSALVTLTMIAYRQNGTSVSKSYSLANTLGSKTKLFCPFDATRGVLFKYLFTSEAPFWLYREESTVRIQPWGTSDPLETTPFGNDDLGMPMRSMVDAGQAAARSGAGHR